MSTQDAVIQDAVIQVFAELTRYPLEILTPEAELEAELGIDSVKRAEIVGALQRRFDLPAELSPPAGLTTIGAVARFVEEARGGRGGTGGRGGRGAPGTPPSSFEDGIGWAEAGPSVRPAPAPRPSAPVGQPPSAPSPAPSPAAPALPSDERTRQTLLAVLHELTGEALKRVSVQPSAGPVASASEAPSAGVGAWIPEGQRPLAGRVALVTGSGHGLGRVIALRLGALGASVVVNSFHSRDRGEQTADEIRARGGDAVHLWGSVARRDHLERVFEAIEARFGGLDHLVSNASNGIIAPLAQVTEEHWDRSFKTNVVGLHRASMLAAPLMARRGGGRILAISSPGADRTIEHFGCQGPVKAALESLVRYLAVELGPQNIQVNALSAGPIYGELLDRYPDGERLIPYWESRTADGRLARAEEVAEVVAWMLSPMARAVSGATLLVDNTGSIRI